MIRLLEKGNIGQKKSYHAKSKGNKCFCINILDVSFSVFHIPASLLRLKAIIKAMIPEIMLPINIQMLGLGLGDASGTIKAAPNQPAERLTKRSDNVMSQVGSTFSTKSNLAVSQNCVNQIFIEVEGPERSRRGAVG